MVRLRFGEAPADSLNISGSTCFVGAQARLLSDTYFSLYQQCCDNCPAERELLSTEEAVSAEAIQAGWFITGFESLCPACYARKLAHFPSVSNGTLLTIDIVSP